MTITIGNYTFNGPYPSIGPIGDRSGVYAILCYRETKYYIIDVGETATVRSRINTHEREGCWRRECQGTLNYAVRYTPNLKQAERMKIEQEIRTQFNPPCGKR